VIVITYIQKYINGQITRTPLDKGIDSLKNSVTT